jgi:hypothetical protein
VLSGDVAGCVQMCRQADCCIKRERPRHCEKIDVHRTAGGRAAGAEAAGTNARGLPLTPGTGCDHTGFHGSMLLESGIAASTGQCLRHCWENLTAFRPVQKCWASQ